MPNYPLLVTMQKAGVVPQNLKARLQSLTMVQCLVMVAPWWSGLVPKSEKNCIEVQASPHVNFIAAHN